MKANLEIYIDGTVEERLPQLITSNSPLKLEKQIMDYYTLRSVNPVLDHFFIYGSSDSEVMLVNPLHGEAQKALGFKPESDLFYRGCILNPKKIAVFRKIMKHITTNDISFYMTATDSIGEEILIRGYNPITDTEIHNPDCKETQLNLLDELIFLK